MKLYEYPELNEPQTVRSSILITSIRVEEGPGHDYVHIWNRGGKSGTLCVNSGDGDEVAQRLLPDARVSHVEES